MFSQEVTLLHEIMAAYPHRNPNCNTLDEFIGKMEGFRARYQKIIEVLPPDKAAELFSPTITTAVVESFQSLDAAEEVNAAVVTDEAGGTDE